MLKHTRVTNTPDTQRMAQAMRMPGIDPRTWVSYAVVSAITFDPEHGVIADVILMPGGTQGSARVSTEFAGAGFGFHFPLRVDDEVLVELADGDPDHGYIITRRFWSPADQPPSDAVNNPNSVVLVTDNDQDLRISAQGVGKIGIGVDGGEVDLGSLDSSQVENVATVTDLNNIIGSLSNAVILSAWAAYILSVVGGTPSPNVLIAAYKTYFETNPAGGSSVVKAKRGGIVDTP